MPQLPTTSTARSTQNEQRDPGRLALRNWAFTSKVTGEMVTFTCMPGCTIDHASDADTPVHPEGVYCLTDQAAIELPLFGPLCESKSPEVFRVLNWQMGVDPFSAKIAERLPHVDLEVIDEHWIEGLDPDALALVIGQLQAQVDSLRAAHAQLVRVRADYAAEQILAALRPSEVTA